MKGMKAGGTGATVSPQQEAIGLGSTRETGAEAFEAIAKQLIEAGWDGDEENLECTGTRKNPEYKYGTCCFPGANFEAIQAVVLRQLGKTNTASSLQPLNQIQLGLSASVRAEQALGIPENSYANALSLLKDHLSALQNPFLAKAICDKLQVVDLTGWYQMEEIIRTVVDEGWPKETKDLLRSYFVEFRKEALAQRQQITVAVEKMKQDLQQVAQGLGTRTEINLQEFGDWYEFNTLFKMPLFAALSSSHFIKIRRYIEENAVDDLREFVEGLDLKGVDKQLSDTGYEYDLATLLAEVIKQKPVKSQGIVTHWSQPKDFFVGKLLSIHMPSGKMFDGLIENCERVKDALVFQLDNGSEVSVQRGTYVTTVNQKRCHRHMISDIETHILQEGELITISHDAEASHNGFIVPGEYLLQGFKQRAGGGLANGEFDAYHEYLFADPQTKIGKFRVSAGFLEKQISVIEVSQWNTDLQRFEPKAGMSLQLFERCHLAWKKIPIPLSDINKDNADKSILIKQELDENREQRKRLEQITQELQVLRQKFQKRENEPLMEVLLDHLVKSGMKEIDPALLSGEHATLLEEIKTLSRKYYDTLQMVRSPAQILLEVVLDANYVKLVDPQDSMLIARTMQLLKEAKQHVDRINERDLVLFMGNTGSGKSASIAYLMQAPLETKKNRVGEDVLHISKNANDYPKIGHAIGTSETIYTQGYQIPGIPCLVADCAGFDDTRGHDFELCTHFSIDQAVQKSKSLLSLVIVIPVTAFLLDKGNPVVELVNRIQERFKSTFDPDNPQASSKIHLLLTKRGHAKASAVKAIEEGTRFEELVKEMEKQLDSLRQSGGPLDSFKEQAIEKRQRIWKAILQMYQSGRVHFIDIRNQKNRRELLETFSQPASVVDKTQYVPAMASESMHKKFGGQVEAAARTWTKLILGRFLKTLPEEIQLTKEVLQQLNNELQEAQSEREEQQRQLRAYFENISKLILQIECLGANEDSIVDTALKAQRLELITGKSLNALLIERREELGELLERRRKLEEVKVEIEKREAESSSILEIRRRLEATTVATGLSCVSFLIFSGFLPLAATLSFVSTIVPTVYTMTKSATLESEILILKEWIEKLKTNEGNELQVLMMNYFEMIKKKKLEDFTATDQTSIKVAIEETKRRMDRLQKDRRNLAIIIKTQWDVAKLVREFADHVCEGVSLPSQAATAGQNPNLAVQTCKEYIELFDQHKDTLLPKIKEDFGI